MGKAIRYGLDNDIRDACVFPMNHFREGGDCLARLPFDVVCVGG